MTEDALNRIEAAISEEQGFIVTRQRAYELVPLLLNVARAADDACAYLHENRYPLVNALAALDQYVNEHLPEQP